MTAGMHEDADMLEQAALDIGLLFYRDETCPQKACIENTDASERATAPSGSLSLRGVGLGQQNE